MPLYMATYETACMTRQHLEQLVARVQAAAGECRSRGLSVSFSGGLLVWFFEAPGREELDAWLVPLQMRNYRVLARVDYRADDTGTLVAP